jgi:F-type H+-transporting ATPase subunit epsilon
MSDSINTKVFPVDLVTPEGQLFGGSASFVAIPAHDGEMGFAWLRAPVMSTLGNGEVRIHVAGSNQVEYFIVQGGFAGTDGDKMVILASRAQRRDAYDLVSLDERRAGIEQQIKTTEDDDPELPFLYDELEWVSLVHQIIRRVR